MLFRPDKCQVLKIALGKLIVVNYTLLGNSIVPATQADYQGVTVTHYLS